MADAGQGAWPPGYPDGARPTYDLASIRRWMEVFVRRFFANQFKRSAIPNGPKVVAGGSLSPRGDWRMPSDAGGRVARRARRQRPQELTAADLGVCSDVRVQRCQRRDILRLGTTEVRG